MKYTAIVILNYNNYNDTINCVNSVLKYNTASVKFFVVDNGSPDKSCVPSLDKYFRSTFSKDYLRVKDGEKKDLCDFPNLTFITSDINDGYARGNNKALKYIQNDEDAEYILILNNDILFVQDIIPSLIKNVMTLPNAAIVSPLLLKRDGKSIDYNCARKEASVANIILQNIFIALHLNFYDKKRYIIKYDKSKINQSSVKIELPSGSCMLLRKDIFIKIGFFDSKTFLFYEEDILYKKTSAMHKVNYLIPSLRCIHLGGQSTSKRRNDYKFIFRSYKSQTYYIHQYSGANFLQIFLYHASLKLVHASELCSSFVKKILKLK